MFLLLPRRCFKFDAARTEGLFSICWASLLFLALASCWCCSEARIVTGVGCLFSSSIVKRSFRDNLVVLFSTTFGSDCASIFRSWESKEMDSRAPLVAAAGGFAESEQTRTTRVYLLGAWVRRLPKGYDAKLTPGGLAI